jgi:transcriptional regulator with GAF, ATPase, and Fis domain
MHMGSRILIVEDLFIEANDLRIILERAGHTISGIAKSVEMALTYLKAGTTDIVLLDIFLAGKLTGIDLGKMLAKDNIPFIYLSANSNPSTLDEAKATQPYGFLVKPFREKDILVALDVATYRHNYIREQANKQQRWLANSLTGITESEGSKNEKLLRLVKALKLFFPFDHVVIDTDLGRANLSSMFTFKRIGYDEFTSMSAGQFVFDAGLSGDNAVLFKKSRLKLLKPMVLTGSNFLAANTGIAVCELIRRNWKVKSNLWMPLLEEGETAMSISFYSLDPNGFNDEHVDLLVPMEHLLRQILRDIGLEKDVEESFFKSDTFNYSDGPTPSMGGIVGKSLQLLQVLDQVAQVATYETSVLILGETGVGKEGLAKSIHELSNRRSKPLVKLNCASVPASLIESELFGHEKGAFTGANERRIGKFEQAQGGTIFLDEIGEIPLELQSKLLRVLQEKEIERIGGRTTIKIDVRIIAATNRNLHKEVAEGNFRIDLYYRLNVFPICLPPLRERKVDIPLLADHFLLKFAQESKSARKFISQEVMELLMEYSWPGNIRELEHLIERSILMSPTETISVIELNEPDAKVESLNIKGQLAVHSGDTDKEHILAALEKTNGKISGKGGAAEILNIPATTLNAKMRKLGISWKFIFD